MASINKRGKKWRAHVSVGGVTRTKTKNTKREAEDWAYQTEKELRSLVGGVSLTHTVRDVFDRYARDVSPTKRGARWELLRLKALSKDPLADIKLSDLKPADVGRWRDRRLKDVTGSTVNRELNLISNCFNIAVDEWGWMLESPTRKVRRPPSSKPRDRIITDHELEVLSLCLGFDGKRIDTVASRVGAALHFAIETAMRAGEICGLGPGDVSGRVAHLPDTKNGFARDVPLSKKALYLWGLTEGEGFGLTPQQLDANFRKYRDRSGIKDLVFHDSRHTAITRLAEKLDVLALARMTGHRDIKQLMVYYNKKAEDIAGQLD